MDGVSYSMPKNPLLCVKDNTAKECLLQTLKWSQNILSEGKQANLNLWRKSENMFQGYVQEVI